MALRNLYVVVVVARWLLRYVEWLVDELTDEKVERVRVKDYSWNRDVDVTEDASDCRRHESSDVVRKWKKMRFRS